MIQLSIIIPVYNVEKYIRSCLDSIFRQGLNEDCFEVIIVNDGSKDKSMEVVSDFIKLHPNIIVIEQENQGQSVARNKGLQKACGQFVSFIDSDDLLVDGCLPVLLEKALRSSVDMVTADYIKKTDEEIAHEFFSYDNNKANHEVLLYDKEAVLDSFNPQICYVWRTLFRKGFLDKNKLFFLPGIFFEDIVFSTECYLSAEKALTVSIPFYIYRQHTNSTVSSINVKKLLDFNQVIAYLWSKLTNNNSLTKAEYIKIVDTIFATFSVEMWYLTHEKGLYDYRRVVVNDLRMRVPNLKFENGMKQLFVSTIFKYAPFYYLWFKTIF